MHRPTALMMALALTGVSASSLRAAAGGPAYERHEDDGEQPPPPPAPRGAIATLKALYKLTKKPKAAALPTFPAPATPDDETEGLTQNVDR